MGIDDALKAMPLILERLERIEAQNLELRDLLRAAGTGVQKPIYDAKGLQELGFSKEEAYMVLRGYGTKRNGRLRVTWNRLLDYQQAGATNTIQN